MSITIIQKSAPTCTDPRLKRKLRIDPRDKLYPFRVAVSTTIKTVLWVRQIPILDQGQLGSCTANAGLGCLGTAPFFTDDVMAAYARAFGSFNEAGAVKMYSAEEVADGSGAYPPNDDGSSGTTCCNVLQGVDIISGWTNPVTVQDTQLALQTGPVIIGVPWFNSMMNADGNGLMHVDVSSGIAGGHEVNMRGFDAPSNCFTLDNSWGPDFGNKGSFNLSAADFQTLLSYAPFPGDVKQFVALSAPVPLPDPDELHKFLRVGVEEVSKWLEKLRRAA